MPNVIASFLKLTNPELYNTGHSFRRTSATLLIEAGGDITAVKKLGGWKSTTVAEGYISMCLYPTKEKSVNRLLIQFQFPLHRNHIWILLRHQLQILIRHQ